MLPINLVHSLSLIKLLTCWLEVNGYPLIHASNREGAANSDVLVIISTISPN